MEVEFGELLSLTKGKLNCEKSIPRFFIIGESLE
jgi:hypothetical protein